MENVTDCLNRLWIRSDIHVRDAVPPKKSIKRVDTVKSNINRDFQRPLISKADYYGQVNSAEAAETAENAKTIVLLM